MLALWSFLREASLLFGRGQTGPFCGYFHYIGALILLISVEKICIPHELKWTTLLFFLLNFSLGNDDF
jgi:hypothetical protein